ncbi:MAG: GntR family transcriptional regulator [Thermoplasmata archaeon]|nr:GntR family transcriptional regulator [Thermoplasmata archaeon]
MAKSLGPHLWVMTGGPSSDLPQAPGSLDDRILLTLQGLHGRMAFNGLRRKLGAHPESLARALRRLEREGLVERADGGYRSLGEPARDQNALASELRPIARVELPRDLDEATIIGRLAGRWFGSLRWVGVVEQPGRRLLAWARRDGFGQVLLGVHRGILRVYVPDSTESEEAVEAEALAYELLVQAVAVVHPVGSNGGTAYFVLTRSSRSLLLRDN